jgi:exodeoxyribonuclease VII small subunit
MLVRCGSPDQENSSVARKAAEFDFEKALGELEDLVEKMEQGDLGLEESLKHFERGIALTKACRKALADAEQRVQVLTGDRDAEDAEPFAPPPAEDD